MLGGLQDPFTTAADDPFNSFADERLYVEDVARTISAGESLISAVCMQGYGIPGNQPAFAAAFELAFQAQDFLARVVDEIRGVAAWASSKIEQAFKIAKERLQQVLGPFIKNVLGAVPVIGQVIELARAVVGIFRKLIRWLNRPGPKVKPAKPFPAPEYSPIIDLDRTRFEVSSLAARTPGVGGSPRATALFSPPVWPGRMLNSKYTDVGTHIDAERPYGLLEVTRLDDGTKLVRLRPMMFLSGLGAWRDWDIGVPPYTFPSLVPGSGIGAGNPSRAFEGMFILRENPDKTIGVTPVGARFPQLAAMAGPLSAQIGAATPMLYSVDASELRRRWQNYLWAWLHGLALACGAGDWGEHAGVPSSWYDPLPDFHPSNEWRPNITRREAWAIRAWFGLNFSSTITPRTSRHHFKEGGIGYLPFRDVLIRPDTSIPSLYADDIEKRQINGLKSGPMALYLQKYDEGIGGLGSLSGSFDMLNRWKDAIASAETFSSTNMAQAVCSKNLDESMIIDPQIRAMVEAKRTSAGAGSLSECTKLALQTFQKPATDPGYIPATPAITIPGTQIIPPIDPSAPPGGGSSGLVLGGLALGAAALYLGGRRG